MDAAVTVVGCHAAGMQRESCELDVVMITDETRPPVTVRFGERFFDLYFITQEEALNPADPEVAMSLAQSKPVRDRNLVLSTSLTSNQAVLSEKAKKCARLRLTSCLKAIARADESLTEERVKAADYWLLNASNDFAYSFLYGHESIPAPSHLLGQLKEHSKGSSSYLEAFSKGAGLGQSSRRACAARLDAVSVLYDLMGTQQAEENDPGPVATRVGYQIVKRKAERLAETMEHAESYCFLGNELTRILLAVSKARRREAPSDEGDTGVADLLSDHRQGLLSDRLVREMGFKRSNAEVREGLIAIRERVASLARSM
jgi:hypothetical protein